MKMMAAEVLFLVSSVYFYSMDAQIKALIDRTVAVGQRLKIKSS